MNELESLIQRLKSEAQPVARTSSWRRYDDTLSSMSAEQRSWCAKQESVIQTKTLMYSNFLDYLFELHKDAFVSVGDGKYKKMCEDYIDAIQKASSSYISRTEQLEKQNGILEEQNKRLKKEMERLNEQITAAGSGRVGKSRNEDDSRTGNDSPKSGNLFENIED